MYQNYQYEVDPKDPLKPLFQGTFEKKVTVGGKERRYLVYIPKGARPSTAGVFILPENGKTADDLWRDSWWRMIADTEETKEKLIVFFLEPENGVWNTDEAYGKPDGDVAYIEQVYLAGAQRFKFCVHEAKFYLTGCREGGVLANMAAMYNPAVWAGVATVGGSQLNENYRQAAVEDFCTNLDGFIDETHRLNLKKSDIPMPAWVINDPESPVGTDNGTADYRKRTCGITEDGVTDRAGHTVTYVRTGRACPLCAQSGEGSIPRLHEHDSRRFSRLRQSVAAPYLEGFPLSAAPLDERPGRRPARHKGPGGRPRYGIPLRGGSAAGCANGMFTYRSRSRRSRKSRFRWYSRCTAIPAQAKSTRAIPSGTRLRISMALLWCILRQRRDRC